MGASPTFKNPDSRRCRRDANANIHRLTSGLTRAGPQLIIPGSLLRGIPNDCLGAGLFHPVLKGLLVNVTVENLAPCKKLLRVEVDVQTVDAAFDAVTRDFQRHASLSGFRAGKAPRTMVENAYGPKIEAEVKSKLINENYRKAVSDQKLRVVVNPDIEEIQFGRGQSLQFAATIETEPEFELPEYKGLPVKREQATVTEDDVVRALKVLQDQRAEYKDVERAVQAEDFVVISYTGTCEDKPITEIAPTARGLTEQKNFWVHVQPGQFIPGFTEQLIGAKANDKLTVKVDFPADFVAPALATKQGVYLVEVNQVKERHLPVVDEGKVIGVLSIGDLVKAVIDDQAEQLEHLQRYIAG